MKLMPRERMRRELENVEAHLHLFHRIGGQGDADGVANAIGQQHAEPDGGISPRRHGIRPPR